MMKKIKALITILLIGAVFGLTSVTFAQEKKLSNIFTALILKVLNYDRSLDTRLNNGLVIGVVYPDNSPTDRKFAYDLVKNINGLGTGHMVRERKVSAVAVDYDPISFTKENFSSKLVDEGVTALFFVNDERWFLQQATELTKDLGINSICRGRECLQSGVAFGIAIVRGKPKLFVNVNATKEEGSQFSAKLLSLCEVVN